MWDLTAFANRAINDWSSMPSHTHSYSWCFELKTLFDTHWKTQIFNLVNFEYVCKVFPRIIDSVQMYTLSIGIEGEKIIETS